MNVDVTGRTVLVLAGAPATTVPQILVLDIGKFLDIFLLELTERSWCVKVSHPSDAILIVDVHHRKCRRFCDAILSRRRAVSGEEAINGRFPSDRILKTKPEINNS